MLMHTPIRQFYDFLWFSFRRHPRVPTTPRSQRSADIFAHGLIISLAIFCTAVVVSSSGVHPTPSKQATGHNNVRTACRTLPGLTRDQLELCQRASDVTAVALAGLDLAVRECQHQFRWHRWNCSSLGTGGRQRNPHHSSTFLRKGYREAAFVYAISAAGVTYSIAKACSQGRLMSCGCDASVPSGRPLSRFLKEAVSTSPNDRRLIVQLKDRIMNESATTMRANGKDAPRVLAASDVRRQADRWKWGGCSHNMNFGIAFSEMFLDTREKAGDIQSKINLHNNHAGRLVLTAHMQIRCKCHGMSGSCQMRTCWKSAPDFHVVGAALKQMFRKAVLVDQSNKGNGSPLIIPRKAAAVRSSGMENNGGGGGSKRVLKPSRKRMESSADAAATESVVDSTQCEWNDGRRSCEQGRKLETSLFYYQRSPNFCERDRGAEILGTIGRRCNRTGSGSGGCSTMCCGRGYTLLMDRRLEKCRCRFHWCCQVECDECLVEDSISVCN